MKKPLTVIKRLLTPPSIVTILLIPISAVMLIIAFSEKYNHTPLAYAAYLLSAYTLTVAVIMTVKLIKSIKKESLYNLPLISKSKIGQMYISDKSFRREFSIYQGLAVNALYVVFRTVTSILYDSVWFGAMAGYYFFLTMIRLSLTRSIRKSKQIPSEVEKMTFEYRAYLRCALLMLLLNIGIAGMMVLMVRDNRHYTYPGYVIYAQAAYTFYTAVTAVVNLCKYRKIGSPILSASKAVSLIGTAMSVMALQSAMLVQFGDENSTFRQTMNTATGSAVTVLAMVITVYMIIHALRQLKKSNNQ